MQYTAGAHDIESLDERRFAELYKQWHPPLVALCRRHLGPTGDAEAVAQDAFIRAWRSRGRFTDDRPFWPWLATIARRLCINEVTRGIRRSELIDTAASRESACAVSEDTRLDGVLAGHAVMRTLRALPTRQQRMLLLRDMEGWSYDDIARLEGVSSEAVRGSLRRARSSFRRLYESIGGSALGGWILRRRDRLQLWARITPFARNSASEALAVALAALFFVPAGTAAPPSVTPVEQSAVALPSSVDEPSAPANNPVRRHPSPATTATTQPVQIRGDGGTAGGDLGAIYIRQITPSPSYDQDRTVFASGELTGCISMSIVCQALYRSDDGGAHWTRLPAVGLEHALIALPPTFPLDNRIFASSPSTLEVSEDGGRTFRALAGVGGTPWISPLFSQGDPRIFLLKWVDAARVMSEYDDRLGVAKPFSLVLPDGSVPVELAFAPTYAVDRRVAVMSIRADLTVKVFSCTNLGCQDVLTLGRAIATASAPYLVASGEGTVLAGAGGRHFRSVDGSRSFQEIRAPGQIGPRPVVAPDGRLLVVVTHGLHHAELFASRDHGTTWTSLAVDQPRQFSNLMVLPDGRMLAGHTLGGDFGLRCSLDGGHTWHDGCRPSAETPASS